MTPRLRLHLPSTLTTRLLAALMLVVGVAGAWVGWRRFRAAGASFESGVVQDFLEARFDALSGGIYHIKIGHIHFDIEGSGALIDSVVISTDTVRNRQRARPLPLLFVVLRDAQVRGVVRDADGAKISIDEIRFGRVEVGLTFAPPDTLPEGGHTGGDTLAVVDSLARTLVSWTFQLPPGAPQVTVGRVMLQGVSAEVNPAPGTGGRSQRIERLSVVIDSVRLDRRPEGLIVPVVVHDIRVQATEFSGGWDATSTVSVGAAAGSFRDSTLSVTQMALTPNRSLGRLMRRGRAKRERVTVSIDSLTAHGVDWTAAMSVGAIPARTMTIDGLDLLIHSDKRIPGQPTPRPRVPILQQTLVAFGRPIALDTVLLRNGRIRYQAQPAEGEGVGALDFRRVNARLTGLTWNPDSRNSGMAVLFLRGSLWGVAPADLTIRGPLGSKGPAVEVDLLVGAMPLITANELATPLAMLDIKRGELDSLRLHLVIDGDRGTGEVRPYYHDLSVRMITRGGGFLSRLAGGARTVIANSFIVRDDNPDSDRMLQVGVIDQTRDPWQPFWPFLWACTKGGLAKVAAGNGVAAPLE